MVNLILLVAVALWGLSFIATKIALDYLSPVEIIAVRLVLGIPVLYLILRFKRIKIRFNRSDLAVIIAASVLLGLHFVIQAVGLIYTTATNTAWLIATIPVFIAILSYFILREKLTPRKIIGIVIATCGVILLVSKGKLGSLGWLDSIGDWIILLSCVTWSIYTIMTRNITRRYNPLSVTLGLLPIPAVALALYTVAATSLTKFANLPLEIILVLVFLGVFCLGLAHWLWLEGLSKKGATDVGVFLYFEPVVTTLAAMPILGEKLSLFLIIGAVLIVSGVYLVEKRPSI